MSAHYALQHAEALGAPVAARSTRLCFLVRDARMVLAGAVAVVGALAGRQERFPRDAGRIVDPRLLRFGIAARRLALLDDVAAGFRRRA